MGLPVILLIGKAGVGKDSVAAELATKKNVVCLAQADPIKRLAKLLFDLDDQALYGPSEERNKPIADLCLRARASDYTSHRHKVERVACSFFRGLGLEVDPLRIEIALLKYVNDVENKAEREPVTTRYILQTLGTTWGRGLHPDVWTEYAIKTATKLLEGNHTYDQKTGLTYTSGSYYSLVVITDGRFRNEILKAKSLGCRIVKIERQTHLSQQAQTSGVIGHQSEVELDTIPGNWIDERILNDGSLEDLQGRVQKFYSRLFMF